MVTPKKSFPLHIATLGEAQLVHAVGAPEHAPEWGRWLEEIGFIPGEQVTLMARGLPGNDPLVVRVGSSTFALRAAEAACIHVVPMPERIGGLA